MSDGDTNREIELADLESRISLHQTFLLPELVPEVLQFLEQIDASDWFAALGEEVAGNAMVVSTYSPDRKLTYICVGAQNFIVGSLMDKTNCHFAALTPIFDKLNPLLDKIFESKLANVPDSMPTFDRDDIRGLILLACIEMQHPDASGTFATECCEWILRGKLPIGWDGEYPTGKLVVS